MRLVYAVILVMATAIAVEASCVLKVSTAVDIKLGPFVDSSDGVTPEPSLTISQSDVTIAKNGGAFAQKNDASSCTNDAGASGNYECPLNTTDTNTVGMLYIRVAESGALPVFLDCQVVSAAFYDFAMGTTPLAVSPGMTVDSGLAVVKGSTSVMVPIFIRSATNGAGKTGLVWNSAGLIARYCRVDQGNADCSTITLATMTRGTWSDGGFVEADATDAPGLYWLGVHNAVVASGADLVEITVSGASDTVPTKKTIELVDTGLAAINTKIGTPVVDLATDIAAVDSDTGAIKAKTDVLTFTGANVHSNVQANAATLTVNITGNITGNLSGSVGSVTGSVGGDVDGSVASVTGDVQGNVFGTVQTSSVYRRALGSQRAFQMWIFNTNDTVYTGDASTVTVTVNKDGAGWVAATGTVGGGGASGDGLFTFSPSAADLDCAACAFRASATGTRTERFNVTTQPQ